MNLFIYCSNNPVMKIDPSGYIGLRNTKGQLFEDYFGVGASSSTSYVEEQEHFPVWSPVSYTTGTSTTVGEPQSWGNASKPIALFLEHESTNMGDSVSYGLKISNEQVTLKRTFSDDNIGYSLSCENSEFGVSINPSKFRAELTYSVTKGNTTSYQKIGINGWFIVAVVYFFSTGDASVFTAQGGLAK